jgi:hypothetical protein
MMAAPSDGVVDTVLTAGLVANVMPAALASTSAVVHGFIRASQLGYVESRGLLADHGKISCRPSPSCRW